MNNIFHIDIEKETLENNYYRKVLNTTSMQQLVVMSIKPNEGIPEEVHDENDQFIRIEKGTGMAIINDIDIIELKHGSVIMIPTGVKHQIVNTSHTDDLKLYTIYSPPHHAPDTIDIKKNDDHEHHHHGGNFYKKYMKYKNKYMRLKDY